MSKSKSLVVVSISDVKQDSNAEQRNFKTLQVMGVENQMVFNPITNRMEMGIGRRKDGVTNLWEKSYLNDKMEDGYDATVNSMILGDIVTREVTPYEIPASAKSPARTVNTYTCVVIGDTSDAQNFERLVARAFKSAGHELLAANVELEVENNVFGG